MAKENGGGDDGEVDGDGASEVVDEEADTADEGEKAACTGGKGRRAKAGDEVAFCILTEPKERRVRAVDIKVLPKGTVQFEQVGCASCISVFRGL